MRMTVESLSRGEHLPEYSHGNVKVLLDGEVVKYAVAVDDVEGWVEVVRQDVKGYFTIDRETEVVSTDILYGNVEIIGSTPPPPHKE